MSERVGAEITDDAYRLERGWHSNPDAVLTFTRLSDGVIRVTLEGTYLDLDDADQEQLIAWVEAALGAPSQRRPVTDEDVRRVGEAISQLCYSPVDSALWDDDEKELVGRAALEAASDGG